MELVIEIIGELVVEFLFEGALEAIFSDKTTKPVKHIRALFVLLFYSAVLGVIFYTGVLLFRDHHVIGGVLIMALDALLMIAGIRKFRQKYNNYRNNQLT